MIGFVLLASVGLTFIITDSKLFKKHREALSNYAKKRRWAEKINEVVNCPQCCGVWCGIAVSLVVGGLYLTLPLATSFACYFFSKIMRYLDRH